MSEDVDAEGSTLTKVDTNQHRHCRNGENEGRKPRAITEPAKSSLTLVYLIAPVSRSYLLSCCAGLGGSMEFESSSLLGQYLVTYLVTRAGVTWSLTSHVTDESLPRMVY